jgi:hypothetical protein
MKRLKALFLQKEFFVSVFLICLLLFNWPLVSFSDGAELKRMFVYLFLAWTAVVVLMALVGACLNTQALSAEEKTHEE